MVVSSTTTLFQIRRQRNNTGTYYIKLLFITLLLGMLAYLASRNAVLCVLLNFTVPFALVFFQSDQFAPKGYFGYAMTFVFLELRPPTPGGISGSDAVPAVLYAGAHRGAAPLCPAVCPVCPAGGGDHPGPDPPGGAAGGTGRGRRGWCGSSRTPLRRRHGER